jgi:hypothetical protein
VQVEEVVDGLAQVPHKVVLAVVEMVVITRVKPRLELLIQEVGVEVAIQVKSILLVEMAVQV